MEEQKFVSGGFSFVDRCDSNSKIVGEKRRNSDDFEERQNFHREIRHFDPIVESETSTHGSKDDGNRDFGKRVKLSGEADKSQVAESGRSLNKEALAERNENEISDREAKSSFRHLDFNTDVCLSNDSASNDCGKPLLPKKQDGNCLVRLDLNADAVPRSGNYGDWSMCSSRRHINRHGNTKLRDVISERGNSNVPIVAERDSMNLWKAMKQNGFLSNPHGGTSTASSCFVSSSHGGIPAPRKRGRRVKNDPIKRNIEFARKEEEDRFAKLAAPSGLLNDLNPGIINHVRNKKQVLSIIENLVKSEQDSINFHQSQLRSSLTLGPSRRNVNSNCSESDCSSLAFKCAARSCDQKHKENDMNMVDAISERLKIPISANVSEDVSSLSPEECTDFSSASFLTVKAATVASQWLELLHQDIKGRLLALRCSKRRVRGVISTELPFLILKEFPSNQECEPTVLDGVSCNSKAEMHKARWTALFNQMDQTLSEEEKQLESWLTHVRKLQLHCDQGLQHLSMSSGQSFLLLGMTEDSRSANTLSSKKELAVRAAAASIYSTCNFLISKESITSSQAHR